MNISDAVARVTQIQTMLTELRPGGASASAPASTAPAQAGATTGFASQLAQAQASFPAPGAAAIGAALPATGVASAAVPAGGLLSSGQQQFAARLAADTGLDPRVISAWLLAEESGGAAQSRQAAGNNDWLNIGYTDSGTYGSSDNVWSDPVSAADATAGWLKGQNTIPGYGIASAGVQGILRTAGQAPATQVAAIQSSGWASSGYPDLPGLLAQVSA